MPAFTNMVSFSAIATLLLSAGPLVYAQTQLPVPAELVGTWSSKSNATMTGPDFYDPVKDEFKEPKRTGISYSFSNDGHYEEAYYRAVSNPGNPKCPKGIIQWQHGSFTYWSNGTLFLNPIKEDGRQQYSDPCAYKTSVYTRYNTTEQLKYEVSVDAYHKIKKLILFKKDGAPMMPLYLVMTTPQMLPTTTLHSLATATGEAKSSKKVKRSEFPFRQKTLEKKTVYGQQADLWWWFGVILTATGGSLYYFF